jgi:hypothetical protein
LNSKPQEEDGGGVEEDREEPEDGVRVPVPEVGGRHAERDADDECDEQRVDGQLEGRRPERGEDLQHRPAVARGGVEVAPGDPGQVLPVLHEQRPVVARLVDALLQLVGRQTAAERRGDRVTRGPHEHEDGRDQDEDRGEDQQEPHQDVAAEAAALLPAPPRRRLPAVALG